MLDHNLVLKSDELYLVGNIATDGSRERATGLYTRDTRHLSRFLVRLNDARPETLMVRAEDASHATVVSSNPLVKLDTGEMLLPQKILFEQRVSLSDTFTVDFAIQNFAHVPVSLNFSIELGADFRDLFDIRGYPRASRGKWGRPRVGDCSVILSYRGLDGEIAETEIRFDKEPQISLMKVDIESEEPVPRLPSLASLVWEPPLLDQPEALATFPIALAGGERWTMRVDVAPRPAGGAPLSNRNSADRQRPCIVTTDNDDLNRVLWQSLADLDELRTTFPHGTLPAAGIPWFVAPFGRDSLITGLQTYHLVPEGAVGTLRVLAALQGEKVDPEREEEPGKILHEMRYGEMARLKEIPHTPYFGTVDATPLFVWLFAETVMWTGDKALYDELKPNARRALEWIEQYGDLDGDCFVEYRSDINGTGRISNQVWKDSFDSLNHPDGGYAPGPIAAVEVQGYVYAAYARLAEAAASFGDTEWSEELHGSAERMRQKVEDAFWLPDEGFYAQALDGRKRPVAALSSNPGHLLMAGLPSPERAATLIARMSQPDIDSGWGIRTLWTGAPTFNPMSYHNGSVWPHDNSLIAAGTYAYRDAFAGNRVFSALLDAALTDDQLRLPELFCGFPRDGVADHAPVQYPVSCIPQAWAAGSIPLLIRAALGLAVDPVTRTLKVEPNFPEWLSVVEISDLAVLGRVGSLNIRRVGDGYTIEGRDLPLAT